MSEALRELSRVVRFINETVRDMQLPGGQRETVVWGCLDLAIEYQGGIYLLARNHLWGPAFALLRVLADSCVRGVWLAKCATDEQIELFLDDKLQAVRDFGRMTRDLEANLDLTEESGGLSRMRNTWKMMSSFTHTGFQHIARRTAKGHIGANYPPEDIELMLWNAGAAGLIAATYFALLSKNDSIASAMGERSIEFKERRDANK